ncbi:hypothetical protein [uncultured Shimia sp.]|uniref:hypothetical protein n=1 Tax=uncultured Shimia sp. TaxID=573152 RepID=UPI002637B388|nr:hypothetical protein [uncultured Shimia sp.]
MTTALLVLGLIVLLVVVTAGGQAYLRGNRHTPLSQSQPRNVAERALGQDATTTSVFQDMLDKRQRQEAPMQKDTRK